MPSIHPIGTVVCVNNRLSINDPSNGAVGLVAATRDYTLTGEPTARQCGVDFATHIDAHGRGGIQFCDLDGSLPERRAAWLSDGQLTVIAQAGVQIVEVLDPAPEMIWPILSSRRESIADHLTGINVRTEANDRISRTLHGLMGVIQGHNVHQDEIELVLIDFPGFIGGHDGQGRLPPGSQSGYWFTTDQLSHFSVIQSPRNFALGSAVTATCFGPDGFQGIVVRKGDRAGQSYGVRFPGFRGHNISGLLQDTDGYILGHASMRETEIISVRQLLDNMRGEPSIARRFPYVTTSTPVPVPIERVPVPAPVVPAQPIPQETIAINDLVAMRANSGNARVGMVGKVVKSGGGLTVCFPLPFRGHDGGIHGGPETCWHVGNRDVFKVDIRNLPIGSRVRRNDFEEHDYRRSPVGAEGIIVHRNDPGHYSIRMDQRNDHYHDCFGRVEVGYGYHLHDRHIEVLSVPMPEVIANAPDWAVHAIDPGAYEPHARPVRLPRAPQGLGLRPPQLRGDKPMPDAAMVGRIGTVIHRTDHVRENGITLGAEGVIVGVNLDDNTYDLDFFPLPLRYGHDGHGRGHEGCCWGMHAQHIRIGEKMGSFEAPNLKKGDRVITSFNGGGAMPPAETEGVVLKVNGNGIDVDFYPYRWKHGKDLGSGNTRSCSTVPAIYLKKVEVVDGGALKPYFLVGVIDGKITPLDDQPSFESGQEASSFAKDLMKSVPYKVQVRKISAPDEAWRQREEGRFKDGSYKPMPKGWDLQPILDHFLHLSVSKPGQVAFTPSEEYGQQDRQVHTRPGAYVQKFYPDLDNKQVARYSALAACEGGLEIVNDGKEMARIYRLGEQGMGPDSCMKYDFEKSGHGGPRTPCHPIECYAAGDIALAYLRQSGAIVARCLIWPERMLFTRAYGDLAKIIAILEAEGYKRGNFVGAKLRRVTFDYNGDKWWVCPYVDESNSVQGNPGAMGVFDDGTHLIITSADSGQSTNQAMGCVRIARRFRAGQTGAVYNCANCATEVEEADDLLPITMGFATADPESAVTQNWCKKCAGRLTYVCSGYRKRISSKHCEVLRGEDGNRYSRHYVNHRKGFLCTISEVVFFDQEPVTLGDGKLASKGYFRSHGFTCAGSGQNWPKEDRRSGNPIYTEVNGKLYHRNYVIAHPELHADKTAGITAVEKKMKKMSKPSSVMFQDVVSYAASGYVAKYASGQNIPIGDVLRPIGAVVNPALSMADVDALQRAQREAIAGNAGEQAIIDPVNAAMEEFRQRLTARQMLSTVVEEDFTFQDDDIQF